MKDQRQLALPAVSQRYLPSVKTSTPVRQALFGAAAVAAGTAGGTALSSGQWRNAVLYAVVLAPVTFLLLWAILDRKQQG